VAWRQVKRVCLAVALLAFLALAARPGLAAEKPNPGPMGKSLEKGRFVVYYFHATHRCPSCRRIEEWSYQAVGRAFAASLKNGGMRYEAVNVDEPANAHFVKDFSLYTKSLVIVEQKDGKTRRWKNLEKVWEYLRDQDRFAQYVVSEIKAFMETP